MATGPFHGGFVAAERRGLMERKQAIERRRGLTAGHAAEECFAFEFLGTGLHLLFDQREPNQTIGFALQALQRHLLTRALAGLGRFHETIEKDAGRGLKPVGAGAEFVSQLRRGGFRRSAGDFDRQVAAPHLTLQVVAERVKSREGGLRLGFERRFVLKGPEPGLPERFSKRMQRHG